MTSYERVLSGSLSPQGHQGTVIALELGGTHLRVAIYQNGEPLHAARRPSSLSAEERTDPLQPVLRIIDHIRSGVSGGIAAVGAVVAGPVDRDTGMIWNRFTLPDWSGLSWLPRLSAAVGAPVLVENDAVGAALAEFATGSGQDADRLCLVALGTGIGVATVNRSGRPYRGTAGFHPEAGHLPLDATGQRCYCGVDGCWEEMCSGAGIRKYWTKPEGIDWQGYAGCLARALQVLTRVYAPDTLLIGGGVSDSFDEFSGPLLALMQTPDPMGPRINVRLRRTELPEPGLVGAAQLAYSRSQSEDQPVRRAT